jgi:hypothetical protein
MPLKNDEKNLKKRISSLSTFAGTWGRNLWALREDIRNKKILPS